MVNDPARQRDKLAPRWLGPYMIVGSPVSTDHPPVNFDIKDANDPKAKPRRVHYNRLKPFITPDSRLSPPVPATETPGPSEEPRVMPPLSALSGSLPLPGAQAPTVPAHGDNPMTPTAPPPDPTPSPSRTHGGSLASPSVPVTDQLPVPATLPGEQARSQRLRRPPEHLKDFIVSLLTV